MRAGGQATRNLAWHPGTCSSCMGRARDLSGAYFAERSRTLSCERAMLMSCFDPSTAALTLCCALHSCAASSSVTCLPLPCSPAEVARRILSDHRMPKTTSIRPGSCCMAFRYQADVSSSHCKRSHCCVPSQAFRQASCCRRLYSPCLKADVLPCLPHLQRSQRHRCPSSCCCLLSQLLCKGPLRPSRSAEGRSQHTAQ